jgi:hypothetical protein
MFTTLFLNNYKVNMKADTVNESKCLVLCLIALRILARLQALRH